MLCVVTSTLTSSEPPVPAPASMDPHPLVTAAAQGRLPDWAEAGPDRRRHVERVATLLDSWALSLGLDDDERDRWRAAAYLHDALRDADPDSLRSLVPAEERSLPDGLLHGPAAAARLRGDGVTDEELLAAVAFHTVGDPGLGRLGRALYAADFLEPGRTFLAELRAELRARAPEDLDAVVLEVAQERIRNLIHRRARLHTRTVAFWNTLVAEHDE